MLFFSKTFLLMYTLIPLNCRITYTFKLQETVRNFRIMLATDLIKHLITNKRAPRVYIDDDELDVESDYPFMYMESHFDNIFSSMENGEDVFLLSNALEMSHDNQPKTLAGGAKDIFSSTENEEDVLVVSNALEMPHDNQPKTVAGGEKDGSQGDASVHDKSMGEQRRAPDQYCG